MGEMIFQNCTFQQNFSDTDILWAVKVATTIHM